MSLAGVSRVFPFYRRTAAGHGRIHGRHMAGKTIAAAIVHLARWKGGARRIVRVTEVNGVKDGDFVLNDVFRYQFTPSNDSESQHTFAATGHVPLCLSRLQHAGAELIDDDFAPRI